MEILISLDPHSIFAHLNLLNVYKILQFIGKLYSKSLKVAFLRVQFHSWNLIFYLKFI